jgi:hypothetical protein
VLQTTRYGISIRAWASRRFAGTLLDRCHRTRLRESHRSRSSAACCGANSVDRHRISFFVLVFMFGLALSEDLLGIATASSSSESPIAVEDNDMDLGAERVLACASASIRATVLRSFVRTHMDVVEPGELKSDSYRWCVTRGPPHDRSSNERGLAESLRNGPTAVDAASVIALPTAPAATPHHTSLEAQMPADSSRNPTSSVNHYPPDVLFCKAKVINVGVKGHNACFVLPNTTIVRYELKPWP